MVWVNPESAAHLLRCVQEAVVDCVNVARHGVFYSACQAMMYIFCFRHRQLMSEVRCDARDGCHSWLMWIASRHTSKQLGPCAGTSLCFPT
jgi:hypothetical protein